MSDNSGRLSSSSGEIDLLDLLLTLWKKRITLTLSAVVSAGVGVLLALADTPNYKGEVQVHHLNEIEMAGFDAWNQGVRIATQSALPVTTQSALPVTTQSALPVTMETLLQNDTNIDLSSITSKSLADNFNASYQRGDALVVALRKHSTAVQNFNGGEEELNLMLSGMVNSFALKKDSETGKVSIVFTTSNRAESLKILSTTLDMISNKSKASILRSIQSKLKAQHYPANWNWIRSQESLKAIRGFMRHEKNGALSCCANRPILPASWVSQPHYTEYHLPHSKPKVAKSRNRGSAHSKAIISCRAIAPLKNK